MDVNAIAGIGLQNDLRQMDSISQNMANLLTPGYKRQVPLTTGFAATFTQASVAVGVQLPLASGMAIDPSAGKLKTTRNDHDVVIEGDAYFEVVTPDGPAYTRQGSLHVDVQGRLTGDHGYPLMGAVGEIALANGPFTIDANGDIRQDGRVAAHLKLVRFEEPGRLQPRGGGLYAAAGLLTLDAQSGLAVRTGFQETSNVDSASEMVRLTATVRQFEALTRVVQGYDDSLEKTIRKLGDF